MNMEWKGRQTSAYSADKFIRSMPCPTTSHPLQRHGVTTWRSEKSVPVSTGGESIDAADAVVFDPLEAIVPANMASASKRSLIDRDFDDQDLPNRLSWSSARQEILAHFNVETVKSMLLSSNTKNMQSLPDHVARSEETDVDDLDKSLESVGPQDVLEMIAILKEALQQAWINQKRVAAIQIVIRCSKLLCADARSSGGESYPAIYVHVTDILDTFGNLVFSRLFEKATESGNLRNLHSDDIVEMGAKLPLSARETCRNWLYKISSIRELLPRFYVECATLRCLAFIESPDAFATAVRRLAEMIRGIGDPLVAAYARCYLARICSVENNFHYDPTIRAALQLMIRDYAEILPTKHMGKYVLRSIASPPVAKLSHSALELDMQRYARLFDPAVLWLIDVIAISPQAIDTLFEIHSKIIDRRKDSESTVTHGDVFASRFLLCLLKCSSISTWLCATRASNLLQLINKSVPVTNQPSMISRLGANLLDAASEFDSNTRRRILRDVWSSVMRYENPANYMEAAPPWFAFACRYFAPSHIDVLLEDVIGHLAPDREYERHYDALKAMLVTMLTELERVDILFKMDHFVPFLDLLQDDKVKINCANLILRAYVDSAPSANNDIVLAGHLLMLVKHVHDGQGFLSLHDDVVSLANMTCGIADSFDFGEDYQQQLQLFMDTRGVMHDVDAVLYHLVACVDRLAISTLKRARKQHNRKTNSFVRACVAYSFITIPSIACVFARLRLYLQSCEVALQCGCTAQAHDMLKCILELLPTVPSVTPANRKTAPAVSNDDWMLSYVSNLMSLLLAVPDSPSAATVISLPRKLFNIVNKYHWNVPNSKHKLHLAIFQWLVNAARAEYPYHVSGLPANDALYGSAPKFIAELNSMTSVMLSTLLKDLPSDSAIDVLQTVLNYADTSAVEMRAIIVDLFGLAKQDVTAAKRLRSSAKLISSNAQDCTRSDCDSWSQLLHSLRESEM